MRYPTVTADPPDRLWEAAADGDAHAAVDIPHETAADAVARPPPTDGRSPPSPTVGRRRNAAPPLTAGSRPAASTAHGTPSPPGSSPRCSARAAGGSTTPAPEPPQLHLVAHPHRTDPHAVLLPGSPPTHLPAAHAVGADAVPEADLGRPGPAATRQVADDLPHLADQEHTAFPTRTADALEARHAPAAPGVPPRPAPAARGGAAVLDRTPRPVPGPPSRHDRPAPHRIHPHRPPRGRHADRAGGRRTRLRHERRPDRHARPPPDNRRGRAERRTSRLPRSDVDRLLGPDRAGWSVAVPRPSAPRCTWTTGPTP